MAEMERLKIIERTQRGTRARATSGNLLAGPRPLFGYQWRGESKGAYDVDPATGPIVRRIFDEFLSGRSLRSVCAGLTLDGVPTPVGKMLEWHVPTVSDILKNPRYAGVCTAFRYQTHRVPGSYKRVSIRPDEEQVALPLGTIPAIVSPEEHSAAVERLAHNRVSATRNNRNPESTLLRAGFVRCGICGRSMSVKNPNPPRNPLPVYRCPGDHADPVKRHGHKIPAPPIDAEVWGRVEDLLLRPEVIAAEVERRRSSSTTSADLAAIDRRLERISHQRQNLVRAIALLEDDPDSAALMTREMSSLSRQLKEIEEERRAMEAVMAGESAENGQLADLAAWCVRTAANLEGLAYAERRMVLEALGVGVTVWPAGHEPRWEIEMAPLPVLVEGSIVLATARD